MKHKHARSRKALVQALRQHKKFLLSCHVTPEGDAIGSMLAMESMLRRLGKKTVVVCQDPFPARLTCLSKKKWKQTCDVKIESLKFDAALFTDCPNLSRIGDVKYLIQPDTVIFNIDHHISNTYFGTHNYIRPKASSTAEVVFDLFEELKMPLTRDEARNLYIGLVTDTGSFKYSNTTADAHEMASRLIATGINIEKINDELHGTFSLGTMKLYSTLLGRVKSSAGGQISWVGMKQSDLRSSGTTAEDAEGFIDFLRYLKPVKVAVFLSEINGGKSIRVSFRSKGAFDVNKVATYFDGGGHKKASGCILHTSLEEAERRIVQKIEQELKSRTKRRRS